MKILTIIFVSFLMDTMVNETKCMPISTVSHQEIDSRRMMQILQSILEDPEFLSLEERQKLRIFVIIYSMLESQARQNLSRENHKTGKLFYRNYKPIKKPLKL